MERGELVGRLGSGGSDASGDFLLDEITRDALLDVLTKLKSNSFYQYLMSVDDAGSVVFKRLFDYIFSEVDILLQLRKESDGESDPVVTKDDLVCFIEHVKKSIFLTLSPGQPLSSVFDKYAEKHVIKHVVSLFCSYELFVQNNLFRKEQDQSAASALMGFLYPLVGGVDLLKFFKMFDKDITTGCNAKFIDSITFFNTRYVLVPEEILTDPLLSTNPLMKMNLLGVIFAAVGNQKIFSMQFNDDSSADDSSISCWLERGNKADVLEGETAKDVKKAIEQQCISFGRYIPVDPESLPLLMHRINSISRCSVLNEKSHSLLGQVLVVERPFFEMSIATPLMLNTQIARSLINPFLLYKLLDGIASANTNLKWLCLSNEISLRLERSRYILSRVMTDLNANSNESKVVAEFVKLCNIFHYELNGMTHLEEGYFESLLAASHDPAIDSVASALKKISKTFHSLLSGDAIQSRRRISFFHGVRLDLIKKIISKLFFPYDTGSAKSNISPFEFSSMIVKGVFNSEVQKRIGQEQYAEGLASDDLDQLAAHYEHLNPFVFAAMFEPLCVWWDLMESLNKRYPKEKYTEFYIVGESRKEIERHIEIYDRFTTLVDYAQCTCLAKNELGPEVYGFARECGFFVRELRLMLDVMCYSNVLAVSKEITLGDLIKAISSMKAAHYAFVKGDNDADPLFKNVPLNLFLYISMVFFGSLPCDKEKSPHLSFFKKAAVGADKLEKQSYEPADYFIKRVMQTKEDVRLGSGTSELELVIVKELQHINFFRFSGIADLIEENSIQQLLPKGGKELAF